MDHLNQQCTIHQLPEYAASGHPPSYEYRLPAQIERSALATLHPWIAHTAALSPADAHKYLRARWEGLRSDALCLVREYLLECEVRSVVLTGAEAWVLCIHNNGGYNLVAPPLNRELVTERRSRWHLSENPVLTDFLTHFGGLREDFAPGGGFLIGTQEWEGIDESWMREVKGFSAWKGSLIIFSSRGGDKLLLHPSGRVGWWVADEVEMREAYEDIDTCLTGYSGPGKMDHDFESNPW